MYFLFISRNALLMKLEWKTKSSFEQFWPSFNDHVPVYITSSYMWLLVAHTKHADVQNPIHTCNGFFLSHPLCLVTCWDRSSCVHYDSCFVATIFKMYGFFFTIITILWNVNWPSLVVLKYFSFSRVREVELNGAVFIFFKDIIFCDRFILSPHPIQ